MVFQLKQERVKKTRAFFLETPEGLPYVEVFRKLRFNHLVNHHMDMDMLLAGILGLLDDCYLDISLQKLF